jgi:hypothetical protein
MVFAPLHPKRTLPIAFVVGSRLNLSNHGDALLRGAFAAPFAIRLALNSVALVQLRAAGAPARPRLHASLSRRLHPACTKPLR